jgi:hypothetical protein
MGPALLVIQQVTVARVFQNMIQQPVKRRSSTEPVSLPIHKRCSKTSPTSRVATRLSGSRVARVVVNEAPWINLLAWKLFNPCCIGEGGLGMGASKKVLILVEAVYILQSAGPFALNFLEDSRACGVVSLSCQVAWPEHVDNSEIPSAASTRARQCEPEKSP